MEKEFFITTKVVNILENGDKTKWTVKEFYIIRITKLLMMVSGRRISFKAMVHCTMKKLAH